MCGIIGVIHSQDVAEEIFLGLQNLQHRGQDGGGIVTLDTNNRFYQHRGAGLVDIVFPQENFARLEGTMGVGHTRYATTGSKDFSMLQPFTCEKAGLTIAHNGNLVNFHTIRKQIQERDVTALSTGSDSELILWKLANELKLFGHNVDGLFQAIRSLSETIVGSYSVVGMATDIGMFGFRDPNGIRPLVIGKRIELDGKTTYAFASESTALEFLGYSDIENVEAGQVVVVTMDGQVLREYYRSEPVRHCMFEWVYFARVESQIDELSVYQARFNLGAELATEVQNLGLEPDIVVPVPETSRIAAIALAEKLSVPFREVLIKNRYVNRTFILETQRARQEAIRRKLYPVSSELAGKKVLIVDDSIVRGNTAIKIIELVRRAGAKEIYLASTCPPIQYPCYYGIDFPNQSELLAGKYSAEELPGVLGVDKLIYQSMTGLTNALKTADLCAACLTGSYPTDVSEGVTFSEQRNREREVATP